MKMATGAEVPSSSGRFSTASALLFAAVQLAAAGCERLLEPLLGEDSELLGFGKAAAQKGKGGTPQVHAEGERSELARCTR